MDVFTVINVSLSVLLEQVKKLNNGWTLQVTGKGSDGELQY